MAVLQSSQVLAKPRSLSITKAVALDIFERIAILLLFGQFAVRVLIDVSTQLNFVLLLLVASEGLPVIFVLCRRPSKELSDNLVDWLLAFVGATLPLLVSVTAVKTLVPVQLCFVIMMAGLYIEISAKVILGRRFGIVAANRGVQEAGPYRFVRHPMYLGYAMVHTGFLMGFPSLWNVALYAAELAIQIVRLLREERLLSRDASYRDYALRVPYRLLPMIF